MRGFVCVMAGLAALFFIAALLLPHEKVDVTRRPPTDPQDHHGSPAYYGKDESRGNDDDVVICDNTANGLQAAVYYHANDSWYGGADENGVRDGCSHWGVPGKLKWHVTCESLNESWVSEISRCGPTSFH